MSKFYYLILTAGGVGALGAPAAAGSWYVDGLKGSLTWPPVTCPRTGALAGTTSTCAFRQLWQALHTVRPGDTIYVLNSITYPKLGFTVSGTAGAPITLSGFDHLHPTVVSGGGVDTGIWINANHVVVRNFDVTAPGPYPAISIAPNHHHITIANNVVHDAGGSGINVIADDYVTISYNAVYGNAHNTTRAFNSGISIKASADVDANTGMKMVVHGNVVHANTNIPNCLTPQCLATASDTDGNGIILDTNSAQSVPYGGAFLVANNVVYKSGGHGIYVYKSDNATVVDNTVYENNQDPYLSYWHAGEIGVDHGGDTAITNNIIYSDGLNGRDSTPASPNSHVGLSFEDCTDGAGPIIAEYNLGYNPENNSSLFSYLKSNTNPITVLANKWTGPKFESPSSGDFMFSPASPAYRTGNLATSRAVDILGASRSPLPSTGAYQNPGP